MIYIILRDLILKNKVQFYREHPAPFFILDNFVDKYPEFKIKSVLAQNSWTEHPSKVFRHPSKVFLFDSAPFLSKNVNKNRENNPKKKVCWVFSVKLKFLFYTS